MSFTFLDPHTDNEVDGESFMDLSESDLREMIPNKLVVVKRYLCSSKRYSRFAYIQYNNKYKLNDICDLIRERGSYSLSNDNA